MAEDREQPARATPKRIRRSTQASVRLGRSSGDLAEGSPQVAPATPGALSRSAGSSVALQAVSRVAAEFW